MLRSVCLCVALFFAGCDTGVHAVPDAAPDAELECANPTDFDICDPNADPKDVTRWKNSLGDQCAWICCTIDGVDYEGQVCGPWAPPQ